MVLSFLMSLSFTEGVDGMGGVVGGMGWGGMWQKPQLRKP